VGVQGLETNFLGNSGVRGLRKNETYQTCMPLLVLAVKAFAACIEDRHDIPALHPWCTAHIWLCAVCGCRHTATERSRLPPLEFGTVCHTTSRLHSHCLFSAVVWRPISSDAVFIDYTVVPVKWYSSFIIIIIIHEFHHDTSLEQKLQGRCVSRITLQL